MFAWEKISMQSSRSRARSPKPCLAAIRAVPCALLCVLAGAALFGCASDTDVTTSAQYGFAPFVGQCYMLPRLGWVTPSKRADIDLWPGHSDAPPIRPVPASREEIESEMRLYFYCEIAAGTRIRLEKMRALTAHGLLGEDQVFLVLGRILNGPLAGRTVCVYDFRTWSGWDRSTATVLMPNPKLFVPCDESK